MKSPHIWNFSYGGKIILLFSGRSFTNERTLRYWNLLLVLCDQVIHHIFSKWWMLCWSSRMNAAWKMACFSGYWQVYLRECFHKYEKFDIACFTSTQWAASEYSDVWLVCGAVQESVIIQCMFNPCHAVHVVYGTVKDFEFEFEIWSVFAGWSWDPIHRGWLPSQETTPQLQGAHCCRESRYQNGKDSEWCKTLTLIA